MDQSPGHPDQRDAARRTSLQAHDADPASQREPGGEVGQHPPAAAGPGALNIRYLRRRLGWTQWDLAAKLNVDQGTISRWERGIETPRPASFGLLRDILMRSDDTRIIKRQLALVRSNLAPACLCDDQHRLREFSPFAREHYRSRIGLTLDTHLGWNLERHSATVGNPEVWHAVQKAGLGRDELLMIRMVINVAGKGHTTLIEPLYDNARFVGWCSVRINTFDFPENSDISLERLDAVYSDDPGRNTPIYSGKRARLPQTVGFEG